MPKRMIILVVLVVMLTASMLTVQAKDPVRGVAASAVGDGPSIVSVEPLATVGCVGQFANDDGTFENGYGFNSGFGVGNGAYFVEPYTMPSTPYVLTQACICLTRLNADPDLTLDVVVFDDAAGLPATELSRTTVTALAVPTWPSVAFYDVALATTVNEADVWVGVNWNVDVELSFYFCSDENGPSPSLGLTTIDGGALWEAPTNYWPAYKAMGIRAEGESAEPPVYYPNTGEILISAGSPVVAYGAAGDYPTGIVLPADYDGNGFDTYVITKSATVGDETWYAIWVGGPTYVWVPASQVTILR